MKVIRMFPANKIIGESSTITINGAFQPIHIQTKYAIDGTPLKTHPEDQIATTTSFREDGTLISERFMFVDGSQKMILYTDNTVKTIEFKR